MKTEFHNADRGSLLSITRENIKERKINHVI